MSAYTMVNFKMNNNEDAMKAAEIMKNVVSSRSIESEQQRESFISCIKVENSEVTANGYSFLSNTFCEIIPQIMMEIARWNFGAVKMFAGHYSESCGYEAEFEGRIFKNGKFRMSFHEHE